MKLGLALNTARKLDPEQIDCLTARAEQLGFDSVWVGEAYGPDAVSTLGWLAARTSTLRIGAAALQIPARTPPMTAMTAVGLAQLSRGRFILGLGATGPQVAHSWHGVEYGKPLRKSREAIAIIRQILEGGGPIEFSGEDYTLPLSPDASGQRFSPMAPSMRTDHRVPIFLAAIGPKNVRLAAEVADGLLPVFWNPHCWREVFSEPLLNAPSTFEIAALVPVSIGDDLDACRDDVRPQLALYIGGMGPVGKNFYNDLVCRYGYEREASIIQELFLSGRRAEAAKAVPSRLIDELALIGPRDHIEEQLAVWQASPVTTIIVETMHSTEMDVLAAANEAVSST